ncbi:MAG: hypothetical protein Q8K01_14190 [Sulfurimicrobium sp.]|nr:hypothetical protein [Sulfurimicrobium sp.]
MKQLKTILIAGFVAVASLAAGQSVAAEDRIIKVSPEAIERLNAYAASGIALRTIIEHFTANCREMGGEATKILKESDKNFSGGVDCFTENDDALFSAKFEGHQRPGEFHLKSNFKRPVEIDVP